MIVSGLQAVKEALQSGQDIERLVVDYKRRGDHHVQSILRMAEEKGIGIQVVPTRDFEVHASRSRHAQGLVAYMRGTALLDWEKFLPTAPDYDLIVALDHLEDPNNMGAILRSCEVFGAKAVLFPKDRNVSVTPSVIKASAGAIHHLQVVRVTNLSRSLTQLKEKGFWIYGADSNRGKSIKDFRPNFPAVLVVGNEHAGISRLVQATLDEAIHIPMVGKVGSLNVSVATGILLHQFRFGNSLGC
ncbi:MAG: 23S rRNA (guanosine(2251)-2'-O)-methyltransferase RlmB [Candidatus Margulisiibacteriota bacterium]